MPRAFLPGFFNSSFPFSLRHKLTLLISVLIIGTCSSLSWYFITQQSLTMHQSLIRTSTLVAQRLTVTSRFSVISQDRLRLNLLSDGALTIPEVVYIRFFDSNGAALLERTKEGFSSLPYTGTRLVEPTSSEQLMPVKTSLRHVADGWQTLRHDVGTSEFIIMALGGEPGETRIDLLYPITNDGLQSGLVPSLLDDLELSVPQTGVSEPQSLSGYVQLGVSTEIYEKALLRTIQQVLIMMLGIIGLALAVTIFFARRLIGPVQHLASLASQVSKGDLQVKANVSTGDEIGALGEAFNHMVHSLKQRNAALTSQLTRMRTLNETSATMTSSLDPRTVLDRVLDLLVSNLGFERTLLMLYDEARQQLGDVRLSGVSTHLAERAHSISIPIHDDGTLPSTVVLFGTPILIHDMESAEQQLDSSLRDLFRHMGVSSFILVPLHSQQRVLGIVGACSGPIRSTQDDLELLSTIGRHIGVAIDNAQTYSQLEAMMETLEHRVHDRTAELRAANDKLKELDRLKSSVVTRVSHELRTPLASIKMHVDNVLDGVAGPLESGQRNFLSRVRNNAERLRRLINEMLDLSRIESGHTPLHCSKVTIDGVVLEVLENLKPLATPRHLTFDFQENLTVPSVWADEDKLHQVLMNVLHNAVKFSADYGVITITTTVIEDDVVQVCVADHGRGVAAAEHEKIFFPFHRSAVEPHPNRGVGLGLAISKSLVEMHGGKLWVESLSGEGSRFFFTMPVLPAVLSEK